MVTVPVYAGLWRTVLGGCDSGLHLAGRTGAGKTELAALAQKHYGEEVGARNLPGSWDARYDGFALEDSALMDG